MWFVGRALARDVGFKPDLLSAFAFLAIASFEKHRFKVVSKN